MKNISKHISYKEATKSHGAIKAGIDNTPTAQELKAMETVAEKCFEPLRIHFGIPIKIESFLRKHTPNSQHFRGEAIDIDDDYDVHGAVPNGRMFMWLAQNTPFDQLIWEFGDHMNSGWIHLSHTTRRKNRGRLTVAYKTGTKKTKYKHFATLDALHVFLDNYYSD
jgi:hypothetical protein